MGKRRDKNIKKQLDRLSQEPPQIKKKFHTFDLLPLTPLTPNQEVFFDDYNSTEKHVVLSGVAGTGKSTIGLYKLLGDVLSGKYEKLIIIRNCVQIRDMGHLPGESDLKMEVFEAPYKSIFDNFFKFKKSYDNLKEIGKVEFHATSFIAGCTFENAAIFVDEVKSMSFSELDSIVTRCGENSRIIFAGDPVFQNYLTKNKYDKSGFDDFINIIRKMDNFFSVIDFNYNDVVRSGMCREYIIKRDSVLNTGKEDDPESTYNESLR